MLLQIKSNNSTQFKTTIHFFQFNTDKIDCHDMIGMLIYTIYVMNDMMNDMMINMINMMINMINMMINMINMMNG